MSKVVATVGDTSPKFELIEGVNGFYVYLGDEFIHCLGPLDDLPEEPTKEDYEVHLQGFIEYWEDSMFRPDSHQA